MLAASRYPASLKARIAGDLGHLANDAAAALLGQIERSHLKHLIAAHLSQQNNTAVLAQAALAAVAGCVPTRSVSRRRRRVSAGGCYRRAPDTAAGPNAGMGV